MSSRRRRRDRRGRQADHPEPPPPPPRPNVKTAAKRRRSDHEARMTRLRRARNVVLAGFLLSLVFTAECIAAVSQCTSLPQSLFPFFSSALLGLLLGYVVRIWREQRAFERTSST